MGFFEKLRGGAELVGKAIFTHAKAIGSGGGLAPAVIAKPKESAIIVGAMAGTALIGPSSVVAGAKALVPSTAKGKIAALIGVPIGAKILYKSPKAREKAMDVGGDILSGKIADPIIETIESETPVMTALEQAQKIIKEHPYLSASALAALIIATVGHLPAGLAFLVGSKIGKDKSPPTNLPPTPPPPTPEKPKAPPSTPPITTPHASPSAKVTTPPVSSPIAIPKSVPARRTTTKRKRRTGCPHTHVKGKLNLRWS